MKAAELASSTCPEAGSGNQRPRQPVSPSSRLLGQVSSFKLSTHSGCLLSPTFYTILRLLKGREHTWHCLFCCCFAASPPLTRPSCLWKTTRNTADGLRSSLPENTWRQTWKFFWPDTGPRCHIASSQRHSWKLVMPHTTLYAMPVTVALSVHWLTWVSQHPVKYSHCYAHCK